jgi:hypothetical protein
MAVKVSIDGLALSFGPIRASLQGLPFSLHRFHLCRISRISARLALLKLLPVLNYEP